MRVILLMLMAMCCTNIRAYYTSCINLQGQCQQGRNTSRTMAKSKVHAQSVCTQEFESKGGFSNQWKKKGIVSHWH